MSFEPPDGEISAIYRPRAAVGDLVGRTLTDDEWTELYARHDQYMV